MKMFGGSDDEDNDDGPIGIGSSWKDDISDIQAKKRLAEEIASGLVSGIMCRDEDVWEMVRKIKEEK